MNAVLRSISTIDGTDPAQYKPIEQSFSLTLRLLIGPAESEGEESFDLLVCSPAALEKECDRGGFVLGRHRLIVKEYNWLFLRQTIEKLIGRCNGDDWREIAEKIGRIGYWEFEDYESKSK